MHLNDYFVITGIPRSGTSLACVLANQANDVWCGNEIHYDIATLPGWFYEMKQRLIQGLPVPNRLNKKGQKTTNTMKDGQDVSWEVDKGIYSNRCKIGSKINAPYLIQFDTLLYNRYKIICVIRHPLFVIGSYQMPYTSTLNIANCETDSRYRDYPYKGETKIEKQAELWNYFADLIYKYRDYVHIVKYEDMCEKMESLQSMFDFIGADPPEVVLESKNIESRYKNIEEIKKAINKYCPMMGKFGYV